MQRDVAASVATAMERFDLLSRVTLVIGVLQAGLNISIVLAGGSLTQVMLGGLAAQALALIVYWRISSRLVPRLFPPRVRLEKLRGLIRFGSYVTISQIVSPLLVHLEKFLIGAYAALDQLPYYAVPYSLAAALTIVPTSLGNVIYPAMARLLSNGDVGGVRETLRRSTRYCFVVVVGPVVLLVLYAQEILAAWMGEEFAFHAAGCLRLLSVAMLINVLAWPSYHLLHAAGRADLTARYHLLELVLHVPISIVAISRGGVLGAAVAWLLRVLLDTSLLFGAAARVAGVPGWLLLRDSFGRGILAAAICLPLALGVRRWVEVSGRAETLILLGLLGLGYALPVAWLGLGRDERSAMRVMLRGMVTGAGRAAA
jgi:O-antigen/teichoic acid export membrane protein